MDAQQITLKVNGTFHTLAVDPRRSLLDVLREQLGLTGAKLACDCGECGSCTVLLGDRAVMSCLLPVSRVRGKEVVTIEGLAGAAGSPGASCRDESGLHPLQRAFVRTGATQCGFCIPGMIMKAEALLRVRSKPTREEIVRRLSANLCRCTGYKKIFEAIEEAADEIRTGAKCVESRGAMVNGYVGARIPKADSVDQVTGRSRYAADLDVPGALHLQVVRSPHHHARIVNVDTAAARALPGVRLVLTAGDLPDAAAMLNARPQPFLLARERVRYLGEAVAAVAAESGDIAKEAATLVQVTYEVLDPVLDPAESLEPGSTLIDPPFPNWEEVAVVETGNVEAAFARAHAVVEGVYRTAPREHAPMEPEAGVAWMDGETVHIETPQHHPFAAQYWIASLLDVPKERVRIVCPAMGGNFGHRGDFLHSALLGLTVFRTGRPARIVYTREESLLGSAKATSYLLKYRTGADKDGTLLAVSAEVIGDGGCWIPHPTATTKASTLKSIAMFAPGPYRLPNAHVRVLEACTNRPRSNPMRGTNIPDLAFAWESQLDMLAERLGIDRLEIRIRNALQEGDRTISGVVLDEAVGARATLEALRGPYAEALRRAELDPPAGPWRRGVGLAAVWMVMGGSRNAEAGGGWHGLKLGYAKASAELAEDGQIVIRSGLVEKGQGISIAVQQIAADELGVPMDSIRLVYGDTELAPYPVGTSGQRTLFHAGGAIQKACASLRTRMQSAVADRLDGSADGVSFRSGQTSTPATSNAISSAALAKAMRESGIPTRYEEAFVFGPSARGSCPVYGYSSQLVELDVNTETGQVNVAHVTYVVDAGKVINPQTLEGQVEGGVVMGLSYALKEAYVSGETRTLKEYGLPTTTDAAYAIDTMTLEDPVMGAPFGAKGMAEMTASAGMGSAANAIASACGVRCYVAPMRQQLVAAALGSGEPAR